jgi:hypothetical protein
LTLPASVGTSPLQEIILRRSGSRHFLLHPFSFPPREKCGNVWNSTRGTPDSIDIIEIPSRKLTCSRVHAVLLQREKPRSPLQIARLGFSPVRVTDASLHLDHWIKFARLCRVPRAGCLVVAEDPGRAQPKTWQTKCPGPMCTKNPGSPFCRLSSLPWTPGDGSDGAGNRMARDDWPDGMAMRSSRQCSQSDCSSS